MFLSRYGHGPGQTNGDVATWLMNGASIASSAGLGVLPAAWSIVE